MDDPTAPKLLKRKDIRCNEDFMECEADLLQCLCIKTH